jgi:HK97 family phage portal protein
MQGTSWLTRIGGAFSTTRAAWKATPAPGALYVPRGQAGVAGPIGFPGWPEWEKTHAAASQDEQRVRTALRSVSVYADVRAIATEASAAEIIVKERQGVKLEDVENHPLEVLWEAPNPHMGRSFVMEFWAWSYVLASKAFLYWVPASDGQPGEVWPVPPFMLTPIPDEKQFVKGYVFKARRDATPIVIPSRFITYSHSVNLFDARDGLSFLAAVMLEVEGDIASAEWNRNFFKEQNGVPDGLITVPKDILPEDLARVRLELRDFFGGTRRGVAVAPAGEMDYKPFGRTQKDAEFLEGRKFAANAIGRALGFPDGYWSESANRANAEQARATMIAGAVWPLLVRLAEDLNAQTMPAWYGKEYRVEFRDIRPEDRSLKLQELTLYSKFETVNELRERVGDDAFPKDDPRGLMLLDELAKQSAIPGTPAAKLLEEAQPAEPEAEALPPAESMPPAELPVEEEAAPVVEDDAIVEAGKALDRRRWQTKALKALRDGRAPAVAFKAEYLSVDEGAGILESLKAAGSVEDVRAAFAVKSADTRAEALLDATADEAMKWAKRVLEAKE